MKCRVCGDVMEALITTLEFEVSKATFVFIKDLPIHQCNNCGEYLLDDSVKKEVDGILGKIEVANQGPIKYSA
ncbi:MAG: hypothetical protein A2V86_12790 [Deltaproteobacteria bacterium RBG_16_49_23]|nr:MAG: hypothetical protein A2V86_12790 [Deltaproteobacteria bacterium RBG_16_49_23]